jgi:hypothetical protein
MDDPTNNLSNYELLVSKLSNDYIVYSKKKCETIIKIFSIISLDDLNNCIKSYKVNVITY